MATNSPFPPLKRTHTKFDDLEGRDSSPFWQVYRIAYDLTDAGVRPAKAGPTDGTFKVHLEPGTSGKPTAEQVAAYRFLKENDTPVGRAIVRAVLGEYLQDATDFREELEEDFGKDAADKLVPLLQEGDAEGLKSLIRLGTVHVLGTSLDGIAYTGFEFACTWDDEHGVGVMTHKDRVIAAGGADHSFLEWIAERDAQGRQA